MRERIVLGTRGSELALAQARMVIDRLNERWPALDVETQIIKTHGDDSKAAIVDIRAGRKGLFTGEIERALVAREIDLAVHSAKDLPSSLTVGTAIGAVLPRAPVDDVLVLKNSARKLDGFKPSSLVLARLCDGAIVATGSIRRKHQLRWKRPDLEIVDLRGNVPTRLQKLMCNQWHAIILARAGLERLGLNLDKGTFAFEGTEFSVELLPQEIFLPAGGQGVIAIQMRAESEGLQELLEPINHSETRLCLRAEREFLRLLEGDCNQPIGVLATVNKASMKIQTQVFDAEAVAPRTAAVEGDSKDPEELAGQLFKKITKR